MRFSDPIDFDIPDEWWSAAGMERFERRSAAYRAGDPELLSASEWPTELVPLKLIEPPRRAPGVALFGRERMISVLAGFVADDRLPPIEVNTVEGGRSPYRVYHGYHRYYASWAAGFDLVPVVVIPYFDMRSLDA
jgi:hypothetical protein